jgi:hypothetical protein
VCRPQNLRKSVSCARCKDKKIHCSFNGYKRRKVRGKSVDSDDENGKEPPGRDTKLLILKEVKEMRREMKAIHKELAEIRQMNATIFKRIAETDKEE